MTRPPEIVRWEDLEGPPWTYRKSDEPMGPAAHYGRHFGFARLGINHCRLSPGMRSSLPHAESSEDEFVYVLEGTPDYWRDGVLHRLAPGDAVGFPAGTGLAHSFINNTDADVRLLIVGDTSRDDNRILYPVNPDRKPLRDD
jgi:uncharacterized cupin superfamily protein